MKDVTVMRNKMLKRTQLGEFDFLKYDLCSLEGKGDQVAAYRKMGEALKRTGRPILYK